MQKRGNTKQITNKLIMQWKINNMVICLWMGKNLTAKTHRVIFKSPLPKLHYYHNKRLQARNPKYLTNLHLNPYPNTQSNLFCSDNSPFWCTAPKYVTNQLHESQYATSITNLKILLATKFFSSSTWWRLGRCLVTKPYDANTQQLLHERDELGQELCLQSQFAWTEFAQCLCNLCTVLRLLK